MKKLIALLILLPLIASAEGTYSDQQICRTAIATIMHKDVGIVSASGKGVIAVKYTSSGVKDYKCRIDGQRVMWGNADGIWRDRALDEKVMWKVVGEMPVIRQPWSDGSVSEDEFTKDQF